MKLLKIISEIQKVNTNDRSSIIKIMFKEIVNTLDLNSNQYDISSFDTIIDAVFLNIWVELSNEKVNQIKAILKKYRELYKINSEAEHRRGPGRLISVSLRRDYDPSDYPPGWDDD